MKLKKCITLLLCFCCLATTVVFTGCNENTATNTGSGNYINSGEEVTQGNGGENKLITQPEVNTENFPGDYIDKEKAVFSVISSPKRKEDGKVTGCNNMKIISENKGKSPEELTELVKDEIIKEVNRQVDGVKCDDVVITQDPNSSTMGMMTVKFTYTDTNSQDTQVFSVSLQ